jgi:hypothetical protein
MKLRFLSLALIAALPAAAQDYELGLFVGQQSYHSQKAGSLDIKGKNQTVLAARFGYSVIDLGPALFQLTAGYQPKVSSNIEANGADIGLKLEHQYWSVGAMFNFKAVVAVGAGLEYRSEKLSIPGGNGSDATYGRPWAKVSFGYAFPTPLVKPFIGLEVAAPLVSESTESPLYVGAVLDRKTLAPKLQIGLYGGIRF